MVMLTAELLRELLEGGLLDLDVGIETRTAPTFDHFARSRVFRRDAPPPVAPILDARRNPSTGVWES